MATSSFSSSHWITKGSNHLPGDRFAPFGAEYSCRIYSFHTDLYWHCGRKKLRGEEHSLCLFSEKTFLEPFTAAVLVTLPSCLLASGNVCLCGTLFGFDATRAWKFIRIFLGRWTSGQTSYSQVRGPRLRSWMFKKRLPSGICGAFHISRTYSGHTFRHQTGFNYWPQPICCTALCIGPLLSHPSKKTDHCRIAAEQIWFAQWIIFNTVVILTWFVARHLRCHC